MWLNVALEKINKLTTFLSDESEYEAEYAYGSEIYDDFLFNVGRKAQILKSAIKVEVITYFLHHLLLLSQVWSCLTGATEYHESKILEVVRKINLVETIQNYLPVREAVKGEN